MALERENFESTRLGAAVLSLALVLAGCKKEVSKVVDVDAVQSVPADISKAVAESAASTTAPAATNVPEKIVDSIDPKMVEQLANKVKSPVPLVLNDNMFDKDGKLDKSAIGLLFADFAKNFGCDLRDLIYRDVPFEKGMEFELGDGVLVMTPADKTAFGYYHDGKLVFRVDILRVANETKGNEMDVKSFKARVFDANGKERESLRRFHYADYHPFHPQRNFAGLVAVFHTAHDGKSDEWEQVKMTGNPKHSENEILLDHFLEARGDSLVIRNTADGKAIYGRNGDSQYSISDVASKKVDRFNAAFSK